MKSIILVALALVAVVAAAPAEQTEPIPIVQSNIEQQPDGSYRFGFETGDGITRQEVGEVKEVLDEENKPHTVVTVRGSYTYPGADGKPETVTYEADENGYRAVGNSIPKLATR